MKTKMLADFQICISVPLTLSKIVVNASTAFSKRLLRTSDGLFNHFFKAPTLQSGLLHP